MSASQLYDFEGVVEPAVVDLLKALEIDAYSTQDEFDFERPRPRAEVKYVHGTGQGRFVIVMDGKANDPVAVEAMTPAQRWDARRESAWSFSLKFTLITSSDPPSLHSEYRSQFRSMASQIWNGINGLALTRHCLQVTRDAGNSEPMFDTEKGLIRTDFFIDGVISIQGDAWDSAEPTLMILDTAKQTTSHI